MDIKTFLTASTLALVTATASYADLNDCSNTASATAECLTGEEVDVDNQAADGPGKGAVTESVGMTEDMSTGQADGGSAATVGEVDDQNNGQADGGSDISG